MDKELTFNTGYTNPVDEELLEQLRENFEKQVKDYLEFVEDHISKTMGDHIVIDEHSVGDGGYELSEAIDDVVCVDNIDHSADFLNPPYIDGKILMCESCTDSMFFVNDQEFKKFCKKVSDTFSEELQKVGYVSGNRVAKAIDELTGFDYTFAGLEEEPEKIESTEPIYDISWIRKRMKHCTNPMERKQLEKQLNAAFKAKKKGKKK